MNAEAWWRLCKAIIAGILVSAAAVISFRYLLPALLPFILAFAAAACIRPCALWCKRRLKIGAGIVSVAMILVIFTLMCFVVYAAGARLVGECGRFLVSVSETAENDSSPIARLGGMIEELGERFPFFREGSGGVIDLYELLSGFVRAGAEKLSAAFAVWVGTLIKMLPSALFSIGICFIAMFYLTLDYDGAVAALRDFFSIGAHGRASEWYHRMGDELWEYLRAYLLIMLVTFAELYLGFTVVGIEYALLFAVVIAVVDFLPLLGTGTVLIPWGAAELLLGEYRRGIGILVIYAVTCVVRQLIEPRIVGNFIGTHPLVALIGVYAGLKLFGVIGMIAAPMILYLVKALRVGAPENKENGMPQGS